MTNLGPSPQAFVATPAGQEENPHTIVMHPWLVNHVKMYRLDPRDVIEGIIFGDSNRYVKSEQGKLELRIHTQQVNTISAQTLHQLLPHPVTDTNPPLIMVKRIGEH